uniref:AAA+ ATPase domain-containing protein n=1 Tax=Fagus sylvatica TaxID=28930 RepID=A0A2N9F1S0_FAGSY
MLTISQRKLRNLRMPEIVCNVGLKIARRNVEQIEGKVQTWLTDVEEITGKVMKALKDDNIRAIGVCGMGGTGKTMLVGKVARQAMEEKLFEEVVTIVVSQTPNLKKIQEDIARKLGLSFQEKMTDSGKADTLLHERLKQGKKILIIIDDIWKKLDLEALGISFEVDQKGCKILLTSRSRDVLCRDMDAQEIFPVGVLLDNEATYLFRKIVGDIVETSDFQSIAVEYIPRRCGDTNSILMETFGGFGLPLKDVYTVEDVRNRGVHIG